MAQDYQSQHTGLEIDQAIDNVIDILRNTNGGADMSVGTKKLTTNDYSDDEKAKLAGIAAGANYIKPDTGIPQSDLTDALNEILNNANSDHQIIPNLATLNETGYGLDFSMDEDFKLTVALKNKSGGVLDTKTIDLPLEHLLLNATLDNNTNILTLVFKTDVDQTTTINIDLSTILNKAVADKVDKVAGKQLSTNDYTDSEKSLLNRLPNDIDDLQTGIETGTIVANKAVTAKQIENVSEESGSYQDTPFRLEATGTDNNTTSTSTAPVAKHLELRGNTINWNQQIHNGNFEQGITGWRTKTSESSAISFENGSLISNVTSQTAEMNVMTAQNLQIHLNHVYLFKYTLNTDDLENYQKSSIRIAPVGTLSTIEVEETYNKQYCVFKASTDAYEIGITMRSDNDYTYMTGYATLQNVQLFDLTLLYGISNIDAKVNYYLKFNRDFSLPYYDYNLGELISCSSNKLLTIGYNQFHALDEFIPVIAGQTYRLAYNSVNNELQHLTSGILTEYDGAQNVIKTTSCAELINLHFLDEKYPINNDVGIQLTNNTHYVKITEATEGQILFNLAWDGSRSEYEEYVQYEYDLPNISLNRIGGRRKLSSTSITENISDLIHDEILANGTYIQRIGEQIFTRDIIVPAITVIQYNNNHYYIRIGLTDTAMATIAQHGNDFVQIPGYQTWVNWSTSWDSSDKFACLYGHFIFIRDDFMLGDPNVSDEIKIENMLNYLINNNIPFRYELKNPVKTTIQSFTENIDVDDFGTMKFANTNVVETISNPIVPQGNRFFFPADYVLLLDDLNTYTNGDVNELITEEKLSNQLATKADIDGNYTDMTVGASEQLLGTRNIVDQVPYNLRRSADGKNIANRETDKIIGGTVVWNQLAKTLNKDNYQRENFNGSYHRTFTNNTTTFTSDGTDNDRNRDLRLLSNGNTNKLSVIEGNKYLITFLPDVHLTISYRGWNFVLVYTNHGNIYIEKPDDGKPAIKIFEGPKTGTFSYGLYTALDGQVAPDGDFITISNYQIFDLTKMFGSTIANYVYGLETAEAGKGVEWFRKLFPKDYYVYNAGFPQSVCTSAHKMVGFNQWDEQWELGTLNNDTGDIATASNRIRSTNYIPVLPQTTYFFLNRSSPQQQGRAAYYDINKHFITSAPDWPTRKSQGSQYYNTFITPENAFYLKFSLPTTYGTEYKNDVCINLFKDGSRNGEYEPYEEHFYSLDSSLILHGIPKLDVNNEFFYDGDEYESSGQVARNYNKKIFDQTTTWNYYNGVFLASISDYYAGSIGEITAISDKFVNFGFVQNIDNLVSAGRGYFAIQPSTNRIAFYPIDESLTTVDQFKEWLESNPITLIYKKNTATIEQAEPFVNPQIVNDWGTEEYVDTRDVAIPVGHVTQYPTNLRGKVECLPDLANTNGDYIVHQEGSQMNLTPLIFPQMTAEQFATLLQQVCTIDENGFVKFNSQ